ncbi:MULTISPECIES: radical SAM protein [Clostridiaceae]|uniref:radical SAM/SPASM domain-containing protein n=1 Tax=Clostridiaceae TaxID=31979 RepID=UPI0005532187|nr:MULTISPECIES: radical SAM protein [Clostridiaceae]
MLLKKSKFNIKVDKDSKGNQLIFNTLTNAFALFDEETLKAIDEIEYLKNYEEKFNKKIVENIMLAFENGFLIEQDLNELDILKYYREVGRFTKETLAITIAVTMNCNMNCPYCFEKKNTKRMEENVKIKLIEFIENSLKSSNTKSLSITWFGGEPLLELNTIVELSESFIEICERLNVKYNTKIITNGVLLDRNTAQILLEKCKIKNVQITLDGLRDTNDKRRHLKNNKSSFDIICKNIKTTQDIMDILLRVNIDKNNSKEAKEIVEYFYSNEFKIKNIAFAPVTFIYEDDKNKDNCYSKDEFYNLLPQWEEYAFNRFHYIETPSTVPVACGALSINCFGIDPEGYIYRCWTDIGIKDKNSGDIFYGEKLDGYTLKWLIEDIEDECKKCILLPICQGGCSYHKFNGKGDSFRCASNEKVIIEGLKRYYRKYLKDEIV